MGAGGHCRCGDKAYTPACDDHGDRRRCGTQGSETDGHCPALPLIPRWLPGRNPHSLSPGLGSPRLSHMPHLNLGSGRPLQGPWEDGQGGRGRDGLPPGTWPLAHLGNQPLAHLGTGLLWPSHTAEGPAGLTGHKVTSSSSPESSGQDSGMEPLLSVTWLWPEGWSLALQSCMSGPGPWRAMEPLGSGAHPHPPHPALASCSSCSPGGPLGALLASGTSALLWQDRSRRGGSKRRKLLG